MTVLLFILYLIVCNYIIQYSTPAFVTKWKLPVCFAFMLKVIAGCVYGLLFKRYYNGDDTWLLHEFSLKEYEWLRKDALSFFQDLFQHDHSADQSQKLFAYGSSYWKDLPDKILIKLLALFNLLSRGNYYINVIFFNVITFFGHFYLYKLFLPNFKKKEWILVLLVFLFPPLLFWVSGIRKDGLLFVAFVVCIYFLHQSFQQKRKKHLIISIIFFCFVFLIRNFVALSIVCAVLYYISALMLKKRKWIAYSFITVLLITGFFATSELSTGFDLPHQVVERQKAFLALRTGEKTGSYISTEPMTPYPQSFVTHLPAAFDKAFLHPYISEAKNPLYLLAFTENLLLIFLLLYVLFYRRTDLQRVLADPLLIFCIIIVMINYLLIGYTIPFTGAIVRYRVIFETLLLLLLLSKPPRKHIS